MKVMLSGRLRKVRKNKLILQGENKDRSYSDVSAFEPNMAVDEDEVLVDCVKELTVLGVLMTGAAVEAVVPHVEN